MTIKDKALANLNWHRVNAGIINHAIELNDDSAFEYLASADEIGIYMWFQSEVDKWGLLP